MSRNRRIIKYCIDASIVVFLLFLYNVKLTGIVFHEIVGVFVFAAIAVHAIQSRKWLRAVLGHMNRKIWKRSGLKLTLMFLALGLFAVCLVSGLFISEHVIPKTPFAGNSFLLSLHISSAAAGFVAMGLHIGLHLRLARRRSMLVGVAALAACVVIGITAAPQSGIAQMLDIQTQSHNELRSTQRADAFQNRSRTHDSDTGGMTEGGNRPAGDRRGERRDHGGTSSGMPLPMLGVLASATLALYGMRVILRRDT